jgi:hypothetical protein
MNDSIFFRALVDEDKATVLMQAIEEVNEGENHNSTTYIANASSFNKLPGSTFAYWVSEHTRDIFTEFSQLEGESRTVKQGLATADDFRFLRLWWEVEPNKIVTGSISTKKEEFWKQTLIDKQWVHFAKGGAYSPYYADIYLVVNWGRDGGEIKSFRNTQTEKLLSRPQNTGSYFLPGLTWPLRTNGLSFRILPMGCIFSHKGPALFAKNEHFKSLNTLLALMNSQSVFLLVQTLVARVSLAQSFEVGLIQSIPLPPISAPDSDLLNQKVQVCIQLKQMLDSPNEISHLFHLPALLMAKDNSLKKGINIWQLRVQDIKQQLLSEQYKIDQFVSQLYGLSEEDLQVTRKIQMNEETLEQAKSQVEEEETIEISENDDKLVSDLLSYVVGCSYGRWDIRYATSERLISEFPDPFAPLPVCSPGMLTGNDGLSLLETPPNYPLAIKWDGILVDDPDHFDDIIRRTHEVLAVIWPDKAEAIEQEVCQILHVKDLREYFRKPGKDNFWAHHIQSYSKSRRKAPIYWHLQSSKKNYSIWLYYHKLNKDMLFKALVNYVEPKLRVEEARLEQLQSQYKAAGEGSREARQLEKPIEVQGSFLAELKDFREKLRRVADLGLEPDLNDGVVLNIAPLWELVPWSEAKKYWEELLAGKYEWSSISKQLHEKGLV